MRESSRTDSRDSWFIPNATEGSAPVYVNYKLRFGEQDLQDELFKMRFRVCIRTF